MSIQCIALDLDRTTLDGSGRLSPENRRALKYAIAKGVHIVIASGRSFASLPRDVVAVPGIEYAITSNGAAVYHVPTGTRLHSYCEAFVDGAAYAHDAYVVDPVQYGATPQAVGYIQSTRHPEADIAGFIRRHIDCLDSLDLIVREEGEKQRIWTRLEDTVPDIYITSSVRQLIEISHRDAGKHSGVRFVAERLGLSPSDIAAFGDGDNDADLLSFVGCGIAMANASPACLAAADHVTLDHRENGVTHGIFHILHL